MLGIGNFSGAKYQDYLVHNLIKTFNMLHLLITKPNDGSSSKQKIQCSEFVGFGLIIVQLPHETGTL